ncbi:MerR family transcriptional regulator [Thermobifida halotolerans]|uniref:MerR family transcriptional regulator n=1 Tax=Thermobifida halotolerans TaxID=483545 RepID=A0A399G3S1_9ACTN|nr:MerR family transcriptional regulator [Thermobifida halotolerans]UOE19993.1 MerR family transcriptional regulator [Thermobifida halotolerans]
MANTSTPPEPGLRSLRAVADSVGVSPLAVRLYENRGLVSPIRRPDGSRGYRDTDVVRLRRVVELLDQGVDFTTIGYVLDSGPEPAE